MGRPGAENGSRKACGSRSGLLLLAFCTEAEMNFGILVARRGDSPDICRHDSKQRCFDATKFILSQWFSTGELLNYIYQKLHTYKNRRCLDSALMHESRHSIQPVIAKLVERGRHILNWWHVVSHLQAVSSFRKVNYANVLVPWRVVP
jgi:hypothetical protein